ncbi:MAG TPA: hypothetical protein VG365_03325 [Solirubrobacteraceae bacterium]|jgi:hypothetical protein|nr:hypothetical protein [Solirubrobacteraceae bacterium]
MAQIDHRPTLKLLAPELAPGQAPAPSPAELAEADQLVADLAALVDAGLVTVRRQLGGPARYAAMGRC